MRGWRGAWSRISVPIFKERRLLSGRCTAGPGPALARCSHPSVQISRFHFSLVEGNLVLPSGTGLWRPVGSGGVTQPAHAAACHTAPAIFAKQVNKSLYRKTLDLSSFPFFFFFFHSFSPSPPWSRTPASGSGWVAAPALFLPEAGALRAAMCCLPSWVAAAGSSVVPGPPAPAS